MFSIKNQNKGHVLINIQDMDDKNIKIKVQNMVYEFDHGVLEVQELGMVDQKYLDKHYELIYLSHMMI